MKKRLISLLLTLTTVFSMIPMLGVGVEAAMEPAPLSNPYITPVWRDGGMYTGYYDDVVSNSSKLKIEWYDVDADYYNIAVKALDGEPAPGESESGTFLYDYTQNYTKTYVTISKSDMNSAAGMWVKVFVQSCYSDGTVYSCHYYFKVESDETLSAPTISVTSIGSSSSLKVSWNKVSGATGYDIYRSTSTSSSSFKLVKTISSGSTTSWTDSGLQADKRYYYKVKAFNSSTESDFSNRDYEYTEAESGARFDHQPTLELSIGGNYIGNGVYGTYYPGDTIYFYCIADYSDHIFVQSSSRQLVFRNPNGVMVNACTYVETSSESTFKNRSYTNGSEFQLYIDVPEGIPAGDYTISVTATDGIFDPETESSIAGTSYYTSAKDSLTVRIGEKSSGGGDIDLTDARFDNMGINYKNSGYYQNLKNINLTGDYADDIITVAMSQLGYTETSDGSAYGLFYGNKGAWCAHFVCWCAGRAKVPSNIISLCATANPGVLVPNGTIGLIVDQSTYDTNITAWEKQISDSTKQLSFPWLSDSRVVRVDRADYIPQKGDLIFWGNANSKLTFTHVGIITEDSNGKTYSYIDGNGSANGADNVSLQSKYLLSSSSIIGYARPNYSPHTHSYTINYESEHPHAEYKECSCGDIVYTGNTKKVSGCSQCSSYVPGDLNMDGKTDTNDITTFMLVKYAQLPNRYPGSIDFNGDGKIDTNDAVYLLLHIYVSKTIYPIT